MTSSRSRVAAASRSGSGLSAWAELSRSAAWSSESAALEPIVGESARCVLGAVVLERLRGGP